MYNQSAKLLETHGIRPSLQRLQIYDYLSSRKIHPTADMIYSDLAPSIPTLSKTTVYNTLKTFVEHRLVQTITIENDELRYDADTSAHIHFKCTSCGGIYDIFPESPVCDCVMPEGFVKEKVQLCVWGKCPDCSR